MISEDKNIRFLSYDIPVLLRALSRVTPDFSEIDLLSYAQQDQYGVYTLKASYLSGVFQTKRLAIKTDTLNEEVPALHFGTFTAGVEPSRLLLETLALACFQTDSDLKYVVISYDAPRHTHKDTLFMRGLDANRDLVARLHKGEFESRRISGVKGNAHAVKQGMKADRRVSITMTAVQYKHLQAKAKAADNTISGYIIDALSL